MTINERCIPAGEFKTNCLRLMDEVAERGTPLVVTKRGKPVVRLVPVEQRRIEPFGCMAGTVKFLGDIMSPIDVEWTADSENIGVEKP